MSTKTETARYADVPRRVMPAAPVNEFIRDAYAVHFEELGDELRERLLRYCGVDEGALAAPGAEYACYVVRTGHEGLGVHGKDVLVFMLKTCGKYAVATLVGRANPEYEVDNDAAPWDADEGSPEWCTDDWLSYVYGVDLSLSGTPVGAVAAQVIADVAPVLAFGDNAADVLGRVLLSRFATCGDASGPWYGAEGDEYGGAVGCVAPYPRGLEVDAWY